MLSWKKAGDKKHGKYLVWKGKEEIQETGIDQKEGKRCDSWKHLKKKGVIRLIWHFYLSHSDWKEFVLGGQLRGREPPALTKETLVKPTVGREENKQKKKKQEHFHYQKTAPWP